MTRKGFTLIELLVVIAIIVLLVGITAAVIITIPGITKKNASRATLHIIESGIKMYKIDFKQYPDSENLYNQLTGWRHGSKKFNPNYDAWGFRVANKGKPHGPYVESPDKMKIWIDEETGKPKEINGGRFFADSWNNPVFYGRATQDAFETASVSACKDLDEQTISYLAKARKSRNDFILATAGAKMLWGKWDETRKVWGEGEYDTDEQRYSDSFDDITNLNN